MSKLSRLAGKAQNFKIGKEEEQIELNIKPLNISDIGLITRLGKPETQEEATNELLNKVLKQACPDATEEEINNISMEFMQDLMEAIMEVNGLDKKDVNSDVLEKIRARQGLAKK